VDGVAAKIWENFLGIQARKGATHHPILLDVGAIWCPWCALTNRDTYTNVDAANYINQHFVAVKVDFDA
jgi:uncharacterized protein YyaL (SSP411 family)